jgi:hypothetical protein
MHLVNQGLSQILPNSGYAATDPDIAAARCSDRVLQSRVFRLNPLFLIDHLQQFFWQ